MCGGMLVMRNNPKTENAETPTSQPRPDPELENKKAQKRNKAKEEIDRAILLGIITKVSTTDTFVVIKVSAAFYQLPFDEKQSLVAAVASWAEDDKHSNGDVVLEDHYSGKSVGSFSFRLGLMMN
jgi:hypothetical protein